MTAKPLVLSLLCVLFALAGCGGGGSSKGSEGTTTTTTTGATTTSAAASQAAWANSLCGSLLTWKNSLSSAATTFKGGGGSLSKAKLQQAATTVTNANEKLTSDVKALGAPPKLGGPKAKSAVDKLQGQLQASAQKIDDATKNVSTVKDAVTAVNVATSQLLQMSTDISSTLIELQGLNVSQSWKQAFESSQKCQSLNKS